MHDHPEDNFGSRIDMSGWDSVRSIRPMRIDPVFEKAAKESADRLAQAIEEQKARRDAIAQREAEEEIARQLEDRATELGRAFDDLKHGRDL